MHTGKLQGTDLDPQETKTIQGEFSCLITLSVRDDEYTVD